MNGIHPYTPTDKQAEFMAITDFEAHFEGKAGGGKSEGLLLDVAQHMDIPGYRAIIFKGTYSDLVQPGAIMDRAKRMWAETEKAKFDSRYQTFTFESGATLQFAYLQRPTDHFRYKGIEVQYIGYDQLEDIRAAHYRYLMSRVRRPHGSPMPLKVRSTSTDVDDVASMLMPDCKIVNSSLLENPHIDQIAFYEQLKTLPEEERKKFLPKDLQ